MGIPKGLTVVKPIKIAVNPSGSRIKSYIAKMTCGVYEILHMPSGRRYVGSSIQIEKRLFHHLALLDGKCATPHGNRYLQNLWNKHPREEWGFFLLEKCLPENRFDREQHHMDMTPKGLLINLRPKAESNFGFKHTEETKSAMSKAAKVFGDSPSQRSVRSERAKLQHKQRKLGVHVWKTKRGPRPIICRTCKQKFIPELTWSNIRSQSNYCLGCRPPHRGGRYSFPRQSAALRKCKTCGKEFRPHLRTNGTRSLAKRCPTCVQFNLK